MNKVTRVLTAVAMVMFVASVINAAEKAEKIVKLKGVVKVEMNDEGQVTKLALVCGKGVEVVLANHAKLAEHEGEEVNAVCVETVKEGKKVVTVKSFEVVEPEETVEEAPEVESEE